MVMKGAHQVAVAEIDGLMIQWVFRAAAHRLTMFSLVCIWEFFSLAAPAITVDKNTITSNKLIQKCFLSDPMKTQYINLLNESFSKLDLIN